MNNLKKLYETPELEEIAFASMDAIALSPTIDGDESVGDEEFGGGIGF